MRVWRGQPRQGRHSVSGVEEGVASRLDSGSPDPWQVPGTAPFREAGSQAQPPAPSWAEYLPEVSDELLTPAPSRPGLLRAPGASMGGQERPEAGPGKTPTASGGPSEQTGSARRPSTQPTDRLPCPPFLPGVPKPSTAARATSVSQASTITANG